MSPAALLVLVILVVAVCAVLFLLLRPHPRPVIAPPPHATGQGNPTPKPTPSGATTPPEGSAELVAVEGPEAGQRFSLTGGQTSIGRGAGNTLQMSGYMVSRNHALIVYQAGEYILYDRESANGTFVNGRRIAEHRLQPGDRLQIGPTVLQFQSNRRQVTGPPPPVVPTPGASVGSPNVAVPQIPQLRDYVLTPLKQGGAAIVYCAQRRSDGQVVAVKVLRQYDPYIQQKFRVEARILRTLRHPNIAHAYDFGEGEGFFYIIMEYCEEGALRDRLSGGRPLPAEFIVPVVGQICEGLSYAHQYGIIHRDIKPENIMFSHGAVKLVDFGIAKLTGSVTHTMDGMVIGTPYYLSYEQARGQTVDHRSDIYSLGVVMYEMATGRVPFQGQATQVIGKHIRETPIPPRRLNSAIPPQLEAAIMRALDKDRTRRFPTARDLAEAISYVRSPAAGPATATPPPRPDAPPALIITSGARRGQRLALSPGVNVLERRAVAPDDPQVSRRHAQIIVYGSTIWLEDLESSNGTYLNGQRVFGRVVAQRGDEIRLGNTVLRVEGG